MVETSEDFICQESGEISIGEREGWSQKILTAFPAFQSRNYTLYFIGQLVSLIGTWLQAVAQGWLVLQLTHSAFLIGLVTAIGFLPSLLFSLHGGVIVDRFSKKHILLFTQYSSMFFAFVQGILTVTHVITVSEIMVLSFIVGIINALDLPARQAYLVDMVEKDQLSSAIALNSGMFNGARVIGPAIAGLLIALVGIGGAFLLNGVSYLAAIISLYLMNTREQVHKHTGSAYEAIKEGVQYALSHATIKQLLLFTAISSIFGWSYTTILPIIADKTFHTGANGLGYLYTAAGLGALLASLFISAFSKKISSLWFILGGNMLFTLSIFVFSFLHSFPLALLFLFFSGFGLVLQFTSVNTTLQHTIEDRVRGRVMALYTLMFLGLSPLGSFEIGLVAEHLGNSVAIALGAVIVFLWGVYFYFQRDSLKLYVHE